MEFRTLHLEDKAAVNDVLLPLGRNDSALGFANLYSLTEKYGTQIALEDGVLYVRQLDRIPGAVAYYPPLGTLDIADDVRTLVREAQDEGRTPRLVGLSLEEKDRLEANRGHSRRALVDPVIVTAPMMAVRHRANPIPIPIERRGGRQ